MRGLSVGISQHEFHNLSDVVKFPLGCFLDDPIGQDSVGVGSNHTAGPSLGEGPLGHVPSIFVDEQDRFGDIVEPFEIVEEHPGHLGSVDVPD